MTKAALQSMTARLDRLDVVVDCLGAFEDCYYERDLIKAERDLQAALGSEPADYEQDQTKL